MNFIFEINSAVSMAIKNFSETELDRAVHEELNDTKFFIV